MKGQGTMDTNLKGNPILNLPSKTGQLALVSNSNFRKEDHQRENEKKKKDEAHSAWDNILRPYIHCTP